LSYLLKYVFKYLETCVGVGVVGTIEAGGVLKPPVEEEEVIVSSGHQGKFKQITFRQALELTGMLLYSNRVGDYLLARKPPSLLWSSVVNNPGIEFRFNRVTKKVIGCRANNVLFSVKAEKDIGRKE
jgi:hypothetical protein